MGKILSRIKKGIKRSLPHEMTEAEYKEKERKLSLLERNVKLEERESKLKKRRAKSRGPSVLEGLGDAFSAMGEMGMGDFGLLGEPPRKSKKKQKKKKTKKKKGRQPRKVVTYY